MVDSSLHNVNGKTYNYNYNSKSMVSYKKVRSDGLLVKNVHN